MSVKSFTAQGDKDVGGGDGSTVGTDAADDDVGRKRCGCIAGNGAKIVVGKRGR
jgi:hypothetical protein